MERKQSAYKSLKSWVKKIGTTFTKQEFALWKGITPLGLALSLCNNILAVQQRKHLTNRVFLLDTIKFMTFKILTISSVVLAFLAFKPIKTETFVVDTTASSIEWVAGKIGGSHNGTIQLASGSLAFDGKNLKSGNFGIDMTTIVISDLKGNSNQNLLKHLKGDDFFSVEKNPASTFEIIKVAPAGTDRVNITGNLSIKGITNEITFPATVKRVKSTVVAVAKGVKVDRTKYDIKYRSKSFFSDIGDKAIDDEFELSINLVAKK